MWLAWDVVLVFFFFFLANVCMFTVDFERGVELCVGLFIQAHSMVLTIYW